MLCKEETMKLKYSALLRYLHDLGACPDATMELRSYAIHLDPQRVEQYTKGKSTTFEVVYGVDLTNELIDLDALWPALLERKRPDWAAWWWLQSQDFSNWPWADPRMKSFVEVVIHTESKRMSANPDTPKAIKKKLEGTVRGLRMYLDGAFKSHEQLIDAWVNDLQMPTVYCWRSTDVATYLPAVARLVTGSVSIVGVACHMLSGYVRGHEDEAVNLLHEKLGTPVPVESTFSEEAARPRWQNAGAVADLWAKYTREAEAKWRRSEADNAPTGSIAL